VLSAFKTHEIVAKKALEALDWQITLLVMLWPLSNLFSLWWGKLLEHANSLRKFFLLTGFVGRLSLLAMLWVTNYYQFFFIMLILFSFNALISPAQNSIYQNNFSSQNRGLIFGFVSSIGTFSLIIASYIAGKMLDIDGENFRLIFAIIALAGLLYSLVMAMIKVDKPRLAYASQHHLHEIFIKPISKGFRLLQQNHDFRCFQRNFFLYGIGYLIILPALPIYLVDSMQMSYSEIFLAKSILAELGILFFAPLAGKISGKINPAYFSFIAFAALGIYPIMLIVSSFLPVLIWAKALVYFAFFLFGIAMSMILISWNISSIFFAGENDVSMYQSVHVTLTGIRGLLIPPLGLLILKLLGVRVLFLVSSLMLFWAAILSLKLYFKMDKKTWNLNKHLQKVLSFKRRGLG